MLKGINNGKNLCKKSQNFSVYLPLPFFLFELRVTGFRAGTAAAAGSGAT